MGPLWPQPYAHSHLGQVPVAFSCLWMKTTSLLPARYSPCRQVLVCRLLAQRGQPVPGLNQWMSEVWDRQRTKLKECKV